MNQPLDQEEEDVLMTFDNSEWQSVPNLDQEMRLYRQYARSTIMHHHSITIQLAEADFLQLQHRAQARGLMNEALVTAIIEQYIAGELVQRS